MIASLLYLLWLGSFVSLTVSQPPLQGDCSAEALARNEELQATARAVSDAVSAALTLSVNCEKGTLDGDSSGIAIAVAIAVDTAQAIGEECTADADAAGNTVGTIIVNETASAVEEGGRNIAQENLADAMATALREDIVDPASRGLADEIATRLVDAVVEILNEVQCRCGNEGKGECVFLDGRFIGDCKKEETRDDCPTNSRCVYLNQRLICDVDE